MRDRVSDAWLLRLAGVLVWSGPGRALVGGVALVALAVTLTFMAARWSTNSPLQEATATLGASDARVADTAATGTPPGVSPEQPRWVGSFIAQGGRADVMLEASVPLMRETGSHAEARYVEGTWGSPALEGRFALREGRAPLSAGECATTPAAASDPRLPFGWTVSLVGRLTVVQAPETLAILCAPGTWARGSIPEDVLPLTSIRATQSTYLSGPAALETAEQVRVSEPTWDVMTRPEILSVYGRTSPQKFMTSWLPLTALPLVVGVVLGGAYGVWSGRAARTLYEVGLPRSRLWGAALVSALVGAGGAAVLAVTLSWLLAPVGAVVAQHVQGGVPVNPEGVPALLVVLVVVAAAGGTAFGAALGLLGALHTPSTSQRLVTGLRPREVRGLTAVSVALLLIAAGLIRVSEARSLYMVGGALLGALGCAGLAGVTLWVVGGRLDRSGHFAVKVAGRVLHDDGRRWSIAAMGLTAISGVIATTFLYVTTSAAALLPLMVSPVPSGVVALQVLDPDGNRVPDELVRTFETEITVSEPVPVTQRWNWDGPVWTFASVDDLERVSGPLEATVRDHLYAGGLVSARVVREQHAQLLDREFSGGHTVSVAPLRTGILDRLPYPEAVGLDAALPPSAVANEWLLYLDAPPGADQAAREWPWAHGLTNIQILAYTGEAEASWSVWSTVSLLGFGAVVLVVAGSFIQREARSLQPLMGAFTAQGMSARWARSVVLPVALAFGGVCAAFTLAGAFYAVLLLTLNLSSNVFSLAGVPWWWLAVFVASIPLVSGVAAFWATRGRVVPTLTQAP